MCKVAVLIFNISVLFSLPMASLVYSLCQKRVLRGVFLNKKVPTNLLVSFTWMHTLDLSRITFEGLKKKKIPIHNITDMKKTEDDDGYGYF